MQGQVRAPVTTNALGLSAETTGSRKLVFGGRQRLPRPNREVDDTQGDWSEALASDLNAEGSARVQKPEETQLA